MRVRFLPILVLLAAVSATNPVAIAARPPVQAARITFNQLTRVCGYYLLGTYVVVHDDARMAAGEPCSTFYRMHPGQAAEAVVSFHCIPQPRAAVSQTTVTTIPALGPRTTTGMVELVEYQIAGDDEAHGVPRSEIQR